MGTGGGGIDAVGACHAGNLRVRVLVTNNVSGSALIEFGAPGIDKSRPLGRAGAEFGDTNTLEPFCGTCGSFHACSICVGSAKFCMDCSFYQRRHSLTRYLPP